MPLSKIQLQQDPSFAVSQGRRNLIHNGAMKVAQLGSQDNGTGLSGTACDRFRLAMSGGAAVTTTQDANVPNLSNGFRNSLKVDCTTADTSVAAGDYVILYQRIEGQDLQHLLYGTTAHKKVTVQFWVKSPKTGTHIVELYHLDATYFNSQQYTISSADTWEKKTVTFAGYPTTSFDDDSNGSLQLAWWLLGGSTYSGGTHNSNTWHNTQANRAVGQVNVLDNTANNFYLTGVQLEVSDSATDFEHLSFAEELALCQRYLYRRDIGIYDIVAIGHALGDRGGYVLHTPVSMRVKPSVTQGSHIHCWYNNAGSVTAQNNLVVGYMATGQTDTNQFYLRADSNSTVQTGYGLGLTMYHGSVTSSHVTLSAEI